MSHEPEKQPKPQKLNGQEVAKRNNDGDCWVIVHGKTYVDQLNPTLGNIDHQGAFLISPPDTIPHDALDPMPRYSHNIEPSKNVEQICQ
ncbi:MAG: hypothetical protein Q9181_000449 [Wetmoreana brouardii]